GNVAKLREELAGAAAGDRVLIACHNEAELRRLAAVLSGKSETDKRHDQHKPAEDGHKSNGEAHASTSEPHCKVITVAPATDGGPETAVILTAGHVKAGFGLVEAGIAVLSDNELFRREEARQVLPRRRLESRAIDSFLDLVEGDLVVHVGHGIARF